MMTLKRFPQVKVMITQQDVYYIIPISKKKHKLIAMDLSKQQKVDADPKAIKQINFTGDLDRAKVEQCFFIIEEAK